MYIHIGKETVVLDREIMGIFDLDTSTVGKVTKEYLNHAQRENLLQESFDNIPLAFVVCNERVVLSGISPATLKKRVDPGFVGQDKREGGSVLYG